MNGYLDWPYASAFPIRPTQVRRKGARSVGRIVIWGGACTDLWVLAAPSTDVVIGGRLRRLLGHRGAITDMRADGD